MTLLLVQSAEGMDTATATTATLVTRIATFWMSVVLGLLALSILRLRMRQ
jgi:uncharacterized membrane protein YbhN (UPF0104 family)